MEGSISKRSSLVIVAVAALIGFGVFAVIRSIQNVVVAPPLIVKEIKNIGPERKTIGFSVEGRKIEAFTYRSTSEKKTNSSKRLLLVGGIHGGYEWNSVVLAYELMDYFALNPGAIPVNEEITIIPNANPDGVYRIIGREGRFAIKDVPKDIDQSAGRFNAHDVDLNRNFDCNWNLKGIWRGKTVGTGSKAFSEPESIALRDYILTLKPQAVVFYHSQADAVYASKCNDEILPETLRVMEIYASASGYEAVKTFDAYPVNGASEDWLASIGIPAITVELKTHNDIEFEKNLKGVKALF
ncbi:MAG: succinylglutamate desuccinylase/aspartoacylase family protein [Candidatus Vogelbacteria bacterium]|nr:succinylglutamate desuccinylase/aspartoacylase family protein [Candidatus Vogelbacteria bacterium]